jgi:hypothetical protein
MQSEVRSVTFGDAIRKQSTPCRHVKRRGRGADHPNPSSAEVKGRVELYFYSTSGSSWPVIGWTLPSPLPLCRHWVNYCGKFLPCNPRIFTDLSTFVLCALSVFLQCRHAPHFPPICNVYTFMYSHLFKSNCCATSTGTLFYLTTSTHSSLREFSVAAGS